MEQARDSLLIFDCDGVLVDSEPLSIRVLIDAVEAHGGTLDEAEAYRKFLGRSLSNLVQVLDSDFGLSADAAFLERMRRDLYQRFKQELKPIRDVDAALQVLPYRRCVASSSQPERIRLSLELTGLLSFFEPHIFSATMVERGKPAPDLFLHAAREMQTDPSRCIVIEDSPAGIRAAQSAGMAVFAFTGGSHADRQEYRAEIAELSPEVTFDAMADLLHLVHAFNSGRISLPTLRPT
ncbi:HAD family phosphatase [Rhizobium sp. SSA_523]|uniref:HAD family hydrolase n=1 Tax=Rhizobium sp. SSA_523 TaxID=2952477 RepID=UPI002091DB23|nr:HAD family hydrolase [Rhizobium sp. SSA_523]MCO5732435.1 HAD family hydrolase [Rhizobium sp. SSA_523]WKC22422.1 HAD family hydrolase [Rhizobium sp. SSA_523]